jgi:hypothetical protein
MEEVMRIFYFDEASGQCLGTFGPDTELPQGARPAFDLPEDGRQVWTGTHWGWPTDIMRQRMIAVVNQRYQAALEEGMNFGGKVLQMREEDQANITAMGNEARWMKAAGQPWPSDFAWRMADDSFLPLPNADAMIALGEAAKVEVYRLRRVKWGHVDTLNGMTESAGLAVYDTENGW